MKITFKEMQAEMAALQKKMAEFEKQQAPEPVGRVALGTDEAEWVLLSDGQVFPFTSQMNSLRQGNAFTTKLAAEKTRDRRELIQRMAMAAAESEGEKIWYPVWDGGMYRCIKMISAYCSQLPHFASHDSLMEFMQTLNPDQQKLLICGVG